jgi:hypothetical protein
VYRLTNCCDHTSHRPHTGCAIGSQTPENLDLMRRMDELHLEHPVYGSRRLTVLLRQAGVAVMDLSSDPTC